MLIKTVKFQKKYDRTKFDCGVETLNKYIKEQVSTQVKIKSAACFLAISEDDQIVGYYTVSASSMPLKDLSEELRKKMPRYPSVPVFLIGRLAIDKLFKGKGLGGGLLIEALLKCLELSEEVGACAVVVDVNNDEAKQFYQKYDFKAFEDNPNSMYIPMSEIKELCSE